jgi:hypothetical protein
LKKKRKLSLKTFLVFSVTFKWARNYINNSDLCAKIGNEFFNCWNPIA